MQTSIAGSDRARITGAAGRARPASAGSPPSAGFSLFELLIVLVVVGIAGTIAAASVDRVFSRSEERQWFDRTHQEIVRLRNRAVFGGAPVRAEIDFVDGEIRLLGDGPPLRVLALPGQYSFEPILPEAPPGRTPVPPEVATLTFFPDGRATDVHFTLRGPFPAERQLRVFGQTGKIERIDASRS